jgi:signal transduction histidine kinase
MDEVTVYWILRLIMMIRNIRRKLTLTYSLMICVILLIMAVFFYLVLSNVIHRDELNRLHTAEQKAVQEWLNKSQTNEDNVHDEKEKKPHGKMEWEYLQSVQFALIANSHWKVSAQSPEKLNPLLEDKIRQQIDYRTGSYLHITYKTDGKRKFYAIMRISTNDKSNNILYIGEDVSNQMHLLSEMKWLLLAFTMLMLFVASIMGYIFAGRAMVPITRAFKRQQKFTADASHELRTPLSVLHASVEILEERKHQLPSVHQTVLQHMKEDIQRMTRLTEQLLLLARSDSPNQQMRHVSIDLQYTTCLAIGRMQMIAQAKKVDIHVTFQGSQEDYSFIGDSDQINQLLYILLDNAIKYSIEGGTVIVGVMPQSDGKMVLTITDKGCGIPIEDIPHLFERFFRVDKARTREWGGTGLGLSIAHEIIHNHGGSISVTSQVNYGSTFTVRFPQAKIQVTKSI